MENSKTKNRDKGAFACVGNEYIQTGLTKREYFAAKAMQGICVNAGRNGHLFGNPEKIGKEAVNIADAILKALEL